MGIRVTGLGQRNPGAFRGTIARQPGNSQWNHITGNPGWTPVPCPGPQAIPLYGFDPNTQGSHIYAQNTASTWRPSIYVSHVGPGNGPSAIGIARISTHEVPVRAGNPGRIPAIAFRRPVFLGQQQVIQPRVFPHYPPYGSPGG